jgi:predicted nucleotidyltransferase
MAVLGIVAEYNPFHNGHLHLIKEAKQIDSSAAVLCVMSGNFLQRGEPAICNKWARAEMALKCGADLVIELPFCFSVRSAYFFAHGALKLLQQTAVVTHLAFGAEYDNVQVLSSIADLLSNEPLAYSRLFKENLSTGMSFPLARSLALQQYMGKPSAELQKILPGSNNILAIEYLRVIKEEGLPFTPVLIKRKGSSYHDAKLSPYASATAIRRSLLASHGLNELSESLPQDSLNILQREISEGRCPVSLDALERTVLFKLRTMSLQDLSNIYEISEGLESRFKEAAIYSGTIEQLLKTVKSKRYSLTRIKRTLMYILFALTKEQVKRFDQHGPLYLHILGFSSKGQKILQEMKINSQIPIFNRGKDMKKARDDGPGTVLREMIDLDVLATDIYTLLYPNPLERQAGKDFTTSPIRV